MPPRSGEILVYCFYIGLPTRNKEEKIQHRLITLMYQKGKLIGVISHISALKQRIATQINIMPLSGGKSRITGPGCKYAV